MNNVSRQARLVLLQFSRKDPVFFQGQFVCVIFFASSKRYHHKNAPHGAVAVWQKQVCFFLHVQLCVWSSFLCLYPEGGAVARVLIFPTFLFFFWLDIPCLFTYITIDHGWFTCKAVRCHRTTVEVFILHCLFFMSSSMNLKPVRKRDPKSTWADAPLWHQGYALCAAGKCNVNFRGILALLEIH